LRHRRQLLVLLVLLLQHRPVGRMLLQRCFIWQWWGWRRGWPALLNVLLKQTISLLLLWVLLRLLLLLLLVLLLAAVFYLGLLLRECCMLRERRQMLLLLLLLLLGVPVPVKLM
jgi:hypothetical protein